MDDNQLAALVQGMSQVSSIGHTQVPAEHDVDDDALMSQPLANRPRLGAAPVAPEIREILTSVASDIRSSIMASLDSHLERAMGAVVEKFQQVAID